MYKIKYTYDFQPAFSDIDSYNCAHHSKFFVWFENARIAFLNEKLELSSDFILKYKFPVVDLSCKFYRPIIFGKQYSIEVLVEVDDDVPIFRFKYRITGYQSRMLYAKGTTSHIISNDRKSICEVIPEELLHRINKLEQTKIEE